MVVILGNGFDLNLGLKTGYKDFIESKHFADLVNSGSNLAIHLQEKNELQKWIDIENELKAYSSEIYRDDNRQEFKAEYKTLCQSLCNYLNNLDYSEIDVDSMAYNLIVNICNSSDGVTIYNFNYTKSIDCIISKEKIETHSIKEVHIHGSAESGNIIFGVEDKASIDRRDVFLLKSASPYFACDINLPAILKEDDKLLIVGHSLGKTDHFYIDDFFNYQSLPTASKKFINITHHGECGWDDIMMQLNDMTNSRLSILRQRNKVLFIDTL